MTAILDCHDDFAAPINCFHSEVAHLTPVTLHKVELILGVMHTKLVRIISNWERSGQGEGGHHGEEGNNIDRSFLPRVPRTQDDPECGVLTDCTDVALSRRQEFLGGAATYNLYFWEIADEHQLLATTIQKFKNGSGAEDGADVPLSLGRQPLQRRGRDPVP